MPSSRAACSTTESIGMRTRGSHPLKNSVFSFFKRLFTVFAFLFFFFFFFFSIHERRHHRSKRNQCPPYLDFAPTLLPATRFPLLLPVHRTHPTSWSSRKERWRRTRPLSPFFCPHRIRSPFCNPSPEKNGPSVRETSPAPSMAVMSGATVPFRVCVWRADLRRGRRHPMNAGA